jgi:hypothetical protein
LHRRPGKRDASPEELRADPEDPHAGDSEGPRYWYEGECSGCGETRPLTERDLCTACDRRFDRDLLRLRQWHTSGLALGVPAGEREALRQRVLEEHGEALELLVPGEDLSARREQP